jgi:type II secretory pathway component PulK
VRPAPREDGVVLLLVLVLIVVSISTVYAMAKTVAVELLSSRQRQEQARAQLVAASGVAIATRALLDDASARDPIQQAVDSALDSWALLGAQPLALGDGGELRIHVRDAGSRVGLNAVVGTGSGQDAARAEQARGFLVAALEAIVANTPELARTRLANDEVRGDLADAIIDWIDPNQETRIGLPEEAQYEKADGQPLDRPVFSLDELAPVPGMDPLLLEALKTYFSPYPLFPTQEVSGGINPNTAPPHVLSLLYTGTEFEMRLIKADDVFRLLKTRAEGGVFCPQQDREGCLDLNQELHLGTGLQAFPPLSFRSAVFHVEVEARYANARACIHSVVDRSYPEGPATLYRELGC